MDNYRSHLPLCNTGEEQLLFCPDLVRPHDEWDAEAATARTKAAPNSPTGNVYRFRNPKRRRSRRLNRPLM
jgi:hypothetical protein